MGTFHLDLGIELYDWLDVVDNGDAHCPYGLTGPSLRNIERKVAGVLDADLLRAVRSIALETPLVAMDVVEVSPPYDHADSTVNNAHRVMLEALAGLTHKKRERAGGAVRRPDHRPDPASLRYPVES